MSIPHHEFGQTTIAKVSNSDELRQILVDPWLESETIIIKPNWVSSEPADFTDSETARDQKRKILEYKVAFNT